jgi:molecular chaperone GrpE
MLRQAVAQSSRALRSSLQATTRSPLLRSQFQARAPVSIRTVQPIASRWYSAETPKESAEEAKEGEEPKPTGTAEPKDGGAVSEVDALKKQLETKEKEIIDWKVRIAPFSTTVAQPH